MKINVHGGHNKLTPGAHSLLDELTEDRKVKAKVINLLRAAGHTVYDCTDDKGKTEDDNLVNIVKKCNAHKVDIDVSIHLNCGRNDKKGDGDTGGVEVII
jgi:N-acetylmuramoyl-L-alanine amidase